MILAYLPSDLATIFHYDSKEHAVEDLKEYYDDWASFKLIEVTDESYTNQPSQPDVYVDVTDYLANGEEVSSFTHDELSYRADGIESNDFVGIFKDGTIQTFHGKDIEWDDAY